MYDRLVFVVLIALAATTLFSLYLFIEGYIKMAVVRRKEMTKVEFLTGISVAFLCGFFWYLTWIYFILTKPPYQNSEVEEKKKS